MGFFSKEECDLCSKEVGAMGKRKYDGGVICKDCANLLSPYFYDRKYSTLDQIKDQLQARENNKQRVEQFVVTSSIHTEDGDIFIDRTHGWFAVGRNINVSENPDVFAMTDLVSCNMDVDQTEDEDEIFYDYDIIIKTKVDYAPCIRLDLTQGDISSVDRYEIRQAEDLGNAIMRELSPMGGGFAGQQNFSGMGVSTANPNFSNVASNAAGVLGNAMYANQNNALQNQQNYQNQYGAYTQEMGQGQYVQASQAFQNNVASGGNYALFCPGCGARVVNGESRFCSECGTPVNPS